MLTRFNQAGVWMVLWLLSGGLLLSSPVAAEPGEPAGYVLTSVGEVTALQVDKTLRPLKRKSPFYPGESLRTGHDGKAQLRFRDGSLISMRSDSEILLDEFRFNEPQKGADRNIFTLISGGFRTITGKIGKGDPDAYQMKSAVASIGVRGTTYEAVLNGGLDVAAWQGTIIVANEQGSMAVGVQGLYNFASVGSVTQAPRGLMKPPSTIRDERSAGGVASGERRDGGKQRSETGDKSDDKGGSAPNDGDEREGSAGPLGPRPMRGDDGVMLLGGGPEAFAPGSNDDLFDLAPRYDSPLLASAPVTTYVDNRLTGVTLDRLGMSVGGGARFTNLVAGGRAGYGPDGALYIADNTFAPGEPGFATAPYVNVLSRGLAVSSPVTSRLIDASHLVEWGVWQATAATPAYLMTDPANSAVYSAITEPVYWVTATAAPLAGIAARTGLTQYRNVLGFAGASNSGPISTAYMNLSVNFDTGAALGEAHVYAPGQFWDVSLAGNVAAPLLRFTTVGGTVNGTGTVQGEFSSLLTGNNGQAVVVAFDLSLLGSPATYLEGLALVDDLGLDLRLTATDKAGLDRLGMVTKTNGLAGFGIKTALASNGAGGTPLFTFNQLLPNDPFYNSGLNIDVMRRNGVMLSQAGTHPTLPVSWGGWGAGALLQLSDFDLSATQSLTLVDPIVWMTVVPTLDAVVAARTGKGFYSFMGSCCTTSAGFVDSGGSLSTTSFQLMVDFERATTYGWLNLMELDGDYWNLQFKGALQGARLVVNGPLINSNYYHAATNYSVAGDIGMSLTGPSGGGVAVLYDLEAAGFPNFYAQGAFVAEQDLRLSLAELADMRHLSITSGPGWGMLFRMSTLGASPVFAGDTMYGPNEGPFYLATNNTVWRQGGAVESLRSSYQVMGNPAFTVNWGRWDAGAGTEMVAKTDPRNPVTQTAVTGIHDWLIFESTPVAALAAKTGSVAYNVPVMIQANSSDGPFTVGGFGFGANLNFDTGALSSGLMTLTHQTGQSWNMNFTAPAGALGSTGAFPYIGANGTYTNGTTVSAAGNVALMTTGANAEALAGGFNFTGGGATTQGVFLVCQSGGC